MAGAGRHFRAAPHRSWGQRIALGFGAVFTVTCLGLASVVAYVYAKVGQLVRFDTSEVDVAEAPPEDPQNFLIVGSDSRENVDPDDPAFEDVLPGAVGGTRSDTIIVARVDPESTQIQMLSFPRDLWVTIADTGRQQRINTAYGRGRQVLIDTIQQDFGIPINHYVEVDFTGFQRMVSALGGVPIYLDTTYRDVHSGLAAIGPGCVTLDGEQALSFARSRHLQYRDGGSWRTDPTGDLGRITRQQFFIRSAIDQALSLDLGDVLTLNRLLDVGVDSVGVDANLSNDDLRDLVNRFRSFDPNGIRSFALPVTGFRTSGGASVLDLDEDLAQPIFNVFRGLAPGEVTAGEVAVRVQNGTGAAHQAADTATALDAVGFNAEVAGDAPAQATTTVRYATGSGFAAALVASHLTSRAVLVLDDALDPGEVVLITGTDFTTVMRQPWPEGVVAIPTTTTTAPSTTAPGAPATSTTVPPSTTTTRPIGEAPGQTPPGVVC